ncbi:amino acid permease 1 isoform X2 [Triticum aestivum]|uniref:amino acid permease 1 isoform X2 n=1 Tax=Triticum aestivum TaxID=4565 RepID=UPI001D00ED23|nr:amino acid permease 1-like isoform X2 [Triticum aestivum]XP_044443438.1 amino acid permease 1-like isoform X2 [Triticum aestivum]
MYSWEFPATLISTLLRSRSPQDQNGRRSGVLALLLSVAQMGWILGHIALIVCAYITYYTPSSSPTATAGRNPSTQTELHLYMDAVRSCLGPRDVAIYVWHCTVQDSLCITVATGIMSVVPSNCRH